jgi:transposase
LTAKGVKPICPFHQVFKSTYLFGAYSPINGESFMTEMPNCNTECFQIFLDEFSTERPNELKIIVLDNGAFHKSNSLVIPDNIKLIFLPPYSPELNPAEKIWAVLKRKFTNKIHFTLEEISDFIDKETHLLSKKIIQSICSFPYVFIGLDWTT